MRESSRPVKELDVLCDRIVEVLGERGIRSSCHRVYQRKDGVIKVTLGIYPFKVLEEKRKRKKEKVPMWIPVPGEKRTVIVLERGKKDAWWGGKIEFLKLRDLRTGSLFSVEEELCDEYYLVKNLEVGKSYLLIYQLESGKGVPGASPHHVYHIWTYKELK